MKLLDNERHWNILGITWAVLGFTLGLFGIVLTQALPGSQAAQHAGVALVMVAGGFVVSVMVYTCFALKNNYKLFALFSLGEPELRTDLKRRVLATDDPMPENLTALAAVSCITSQGNTIRDVSMEMRTVAANRAAAIQAAMRDGEEEEEEEEEEEGGQEEDQEAAPMDACSDDSLVTPEEADDTAGTLTAASSSWRKGASSFKTPSRPPAVSPAAIAEEAGGMAPVYETIDRTAAEARALTLATGSEHADTSGPGANQKATSAGVDNGTLPAHYVGTDDKRIEERLAERPVTPSDGSGSVQEAVYDAADGPQEPDVNDDDGDGGGDGTPVTSYDVNTVERAASPGTGSNSAGGVIYRNSANKAAGGAIDRSRPSQMRSLNMLRRRNDSEVSQDFNTYQNATGRRAHLFVKRGARREAEGDDATSEAAGSRFSSVSEISEMNIPQERLSLAPSELSDLDGGEPPHVDPNLMF